MVNRVIFRSSQDAEEYGKYLYGNIYVSGGSVVGTLSNFPQFATCKSEYEERGPYAVHHNKI